MAPSASELGDGTLVVLGAWMLIYRVFIRTRARFWVELSICFCVGLSSTLLAQGSYLWVGVIGFIGAVLGTAHQMVCAGVACITIGTSIACMVWHLGLCSTAAAMAETSYWGGVFQSFMHPFLMTLVSIVLIGLFVCSPFFGGPLIMERLLLPLLAGLLITVGIAGLRPEIGGLSPTALFEAAPCGGEVTLHAPAMECLEAWLAVAVIGALFQVVLLQAPAEQMKALRQSEGEKEHSLTKKLLPEGADSTGGIRDNIGIVSQEDVDGLDASFGDLTKAFYVDEGPELDALLAKMNPNQQKIVEVCRVDEFERDRIVWGGGLV